MVKAVAVQHHLTRDEGRFVSDRDGFPRQTVGHERVVPVPQVEEVRTSEAVHELEGIKMLVVGMPASLDLPLNNSAEEGFVENRVLRERNAVNGGFLRPPFRSCSPHLLEWSEGLACNPAALATRKTAQSCSLEPQRCPHNQSAFHHWSTLYLEEGDGHFTMTSARPPAGMGAS